MYVCRLACEIRLLLPSSRVIVNCPGKGWGGGWVQPHENPRPPLGRNKRSVPNFKIFRSMSRALFSNLLPLETFSFHLRHV